ncbi:uncharacterized protein LOC120632205 [Pararge aegeria]|uniref:uncharacterized protein LOC120632205 n=1 Tax=Pararge aegeria TaxID=116150 RepID=UPI0019D0845C|nr:uncharacterized protein LOC120632205 [Pararge aegeria]
MRRGGGRTRCAQPRSKHESSSSSSSSLDEFKTPPTSAGDVTPPPVRRTCRGGTTRRHQYKKDDDHSTSASLEQQGLRAPANAPVTGGVVRRMRWSQSINESVMRAYYGATEGETNLTSYRSRMLSMFQALQPTMTVTAQRLSDQVRAIQRRHLLDEAQLERLRLALPQINAIRSLPQQTVQTNIQEELQDGVDLAVSTDQDDVLLRSALEDAILMYRYKPLHLRPKLPRLPIHRRNMALVGVLDQILGEYLITSEDLSDTHSILFCGAVTACRIAGIIFPEPRTTPQRTDQAPAWRIRIERRITLSRTLIAKLICFREGNNRPRVMRFVSQAFAGSNIHPSQYLVCVTDRIDFLKQKVYAWAQRIRRYKERYDRYHQNSIFQRDQRKVYRNWEQSGASVPDGEPPTSDAMSDFWRSIWSAPVCHTNGIWMNVVREKCAAVEPMIPITITADNVSCAIRLASNWN